jgi:hypothetical protein
MLIALVISGPFAGLVFLGMLLLSGVSIGYAIFLAWIAGIVGTMLFLIIGPLIEYLGQFHAVGPAQQSCSTVRSGDDSLYSSKKRPLL